MARCTRAIGVSTDRVGAEAASRTAPRTRRAGAVSAPRTTLAARRRAASRAARSEAFGAAPEILASASASDVDSFASSLKSPPWERYFWRSAVEMASSSFGSSRSSRAGLDVSSISVAGGRRSARGDHFDAVAALIRQEGNHAGIHRVHDGHVPHLVTHRDGRARRVAKALERHEIIGGEVSVAS